jgi:exodeoxyribonuclease-3
MRIISCNVNGIRAAARKGFFSWLSRQRADVVCLQETKAHESQLNDLIFKPSSFFHTYVDAEKKGYSGVAIFSRQQPDHIIQQLNWPVMDLEGRYLQFDFDDMAIISLYLPSGTSGEARQTVKFEVLDRLKTHLLDLKKRYKHVIICGDWNIAHKKIDIKNWRSNQKNSGFLPEERAFMDMVFDELGFVDAFRVINQEPEYYTWWSNRGNARANNVGWRIDYQVATSEIGEKVTKARIYKDKWFSDHAPLIIDYA